MFKYCNCGGFASGVAVPDNCPWCAQPMKTFGSLTEAEKANAIDNRAGMPPSMVEAMNIALYGERNPFEDWIPDYVDKDARL